MTMCTLRVGIRIKLNWDSRNIKYKKIRTSFHSTCRSSAAQVVSPHAPRVYHQSHGPNTC